MTLYPLPPQLLMIDLDQPTYEACIKAGSLAGLRPLYTISTRALNLIAKAKYVAAVVLDAGTCRDTFKTVAHVQDVFPECPLVVVTERGEDTQCHLALRLGASHAIKKPCDPAELDRIFRFIMENRAAANLCHSEPRCSAQDPASVVLSEVEGSCGRFLPSPGLSLSPQSLASSIHPPVPVVCWRCSMEFFAADERNSMSDIEREAILAAVRAANGDKVRAAEMLGIGKTTLYRRLQSYKREEQLQNHLQ